MILTGSAKDGLGMSMIHKGQVGRFRDMKRDRQEEYIRRRGSVKRRYVDFVKED